MKLTKQQREKIVGTLERIAKSASHPGTTIFYNAYADKIESILNEEGAPPLPSEFPEYNHQDRAINAIIINAIIRYLRAKDV